MSWSFPWEPVWCPYDALSEALYCETHQSRLRTQRPGVGGTEPLTLTSCRQIVRMTYVPDEDLL